MLHLQSFVCLLILFPIFQLSRSEIFTSSLKVNKLFQHEEDILDELKTYIDNQYNHLKEVTRFYAERVHQVSFKKGPASPPRLKHPNSVYHAIKTFVERYTKVLGREFEQFKEHVKGQQNKFVADWSDIEGARMSLVRLQEVYNLDASDMAQGNYLGYNGPSLSPSDAYEIGQSTFTGGKLNISLQWLSLSLKLLKESRVRTRYPTSGGVKGLMGRVNVFAGNDDEALRLYTEGMDEDPNNADVQTLKRELEEHPRVAVPKMGDYWANFSALCSLSNERHIKPPKDSRIKCRCKPAPLPYYCFKEEILSIKPFASLVYDFMHDYETEHFKTTVQNRLIRAKIGGSRTQVVSEIRTGDHAWIFDRESEIATRVSKRVTAVTGLDTDNRLPGGPSSGEAFQVVNYGLGGHYEVHMDPFEEQPPQPELKFAGERIATFLVYLSDVERGGSTVFTKAGIAVAPIKNMALFWYNYDPSHTVDTDTQHAGCPVLIGEKWITNKWIWTYGNTFRRRCGLSPTDDQLDVEPIMLENFNNKV